MVKRRYDVRIAGRRFCFSYSHGRQRYRFAFGEDLHEGDAATLAEARQQVRRIIRAALDA